MSPLASPPIRGYPDWQRIANYDTDPLFSLVNYTGSNSKSSPLMDVSRFAYIGAYDFDLNNSFVVQTVFYADAGHTVEVGVSDIVLDSASNIGAVAQYRIPCLGPFAFMSWSTCHGANLAHTVTVLATNRQFINLFQPNADSVMLKFGQNINAGANIDFYPNEYYSGAATLWISGTQTLTATLLVLQGDGVYRPYWSANIAAGAIFREAVVTPPGAFKLNIANTGGSNDTINFALMGPWAAST